MEAKLVRLQNVLDSRRDEVFQLEEACENLKATKAALTEQGEAKHREVHQVGQMLAQAQAQLRKLRAHAAEAAVTTAQQMEDGCLAEQRLAEVKQWVKAAEAYAAEAKVCCPEASDRADSSSDEYEQSLANDFQGSVWQVSVPESSVPAELGIKAKDRHPQPGSPFSQSMPPAKGRNHSSKAHWGQNAEPTVALPGKQPNGAKSYSGYYDWHQTGRKHRGFQQLEAKGADELRKCGNPEDLCRFDRIVNQLREKTKVAQNNCVV